MDRVPKDVLKIVISYLAAHDATALLCVSKTMSRILKPDEKKKLVILTKITRRAIRHQIRLSRQWPHFCLEVNAKEAYNRQRKYVLAHNTVCSKCGTLLSRKSYRKLILSERHESRCTGPTEKGTRRHSEYRRTYYTYTYDWW